MGDMCREGLVFFSRHEEVPGGVYVKGDEIVVDIGVRARWLSASETFDCPVNII